MCFFDKKINQIGLKVIKGLQDMLMDNENGDKTNHNKWVKKLFSQSVTHVSCVFLTNNMLK